MSAFIFDFDGTLADTFPLVVDVTYELAGVPRLPQRKIEQLRGLPLLSAVLRLGVHFWQVPKLILYTRKRMHPRMGEVKPFAGIAESLRELHAQGHELLILTSNSANNAETFLRAAQLEQYFSDIVSVYYGNAFYKVYGLKKLLTRNHLAAQDCYYVGNEPLDLRAAAFVGMRGVATTWGGHNRKRLAEVGPFAIINEPKEMTHLDAKRRN